jgi:hypothetical protein
MTSAGMIVPLAAGIVSSAVDLLPEHGKRSPLRALDALQLASAQAEVGFPHRRRANTRNGTKQRGKIGVRS